MTIEGTRRWAVAAAAVVATYTVLPAGVRLDDVVVADLPVDAGLAVAGYGPQGRHFLHYEHGETLTVGVPVRNSGPLPVRVDEVVLDEPAYPLLEPVGATRPVTVAPFEQAVVEVTVRFANCRYYHERATQTVSTATVTGSVLGREFHEQVTFRQPLTVHAQVIVDCPDRTLVRGDDTRLAS